MKGGQAMLCDKCKKNEATVYYTEIINDHREEQHLCEECATGLTSFHMNSSFGGHEFTLGNFLSTILGNPGSYSSAKPFIKEEVRCKGCGMTYSEFQKSGRFGCNQCYNSFENFLNESLKRLHGSDTHIGKRPHNFGRRVNADKEEQVFYPENGNNSLSGKNQEKVNIPKTSEIDQLSYQLRQAIEKEEYEEAARLRDEIRALRKGD